MSTHRTTCCCGCGDNPCDESVYSYKDTFWHQYVELKNNLITEYDSTVIPGCGDNIDCKDNAWLQHKEDHKELVDNLFSNLKGSCPVCAIGESSYTFPAMGSNPYMSTYPDMYELENDATTNSYFDMGSVGTQYWKSSYCSRRFDPDDERWRDIHWPDITPPWRYQFAPPHGFLPWSPQVFAEWMVYWGGPLFPQGDCTMHCTKDNIDCHKIAFVGNVGNYQESGVVSSMKVATIPPTPENNYENWEWIRNWVNSGGKLVIMGEWKHAQDKSFIFYKPGPFYESHVGNVSCDVDNVWDEYPEENMTVEMVNDRLIEFAEFCAAEPGESEEQFFDFGDDLINEVWLADDDSNHTHGGSPNASNIISTCQKTKSPFRKEDENGTRRALPFYTKYAQGLVPVNKGKGLVGSCKAVHCPEDCDNNKNCTVVWKKNGKGAVIVVYDSSVWGLNATQIDNFQYSLLDEDGGGTFGGATEEQLKKKHCNNDFWQFVCSDFLSEEGYEISDNCGDIFWDHKGKEYEENPCLPTAACCMPDGSCENLNTWECTEKLGRWRGRLPNYLGASSNVGKNGADPQHWCNPSCSEIEEQCEPLTGGCCLCQGIGGACCLPDGTCEIIPEEVCAAVEGEYQGQDTECLPGLCDLPDEPCTENEDCQGCDCCVFGVCKSCIGRPCNEETVDIDCQGCNCCVNNKCASCQMMFGACCLPDEGCIDNLSQFLCEGYIYQGSYQGDETFCNGPYVNCFMDRGSCCICESGDIEFEECVNSLLPEECEELDGVWQGKNRVCKSTEDDYEGNEEGEDEDVECIGYGACCLLDESCQAMSCSDCYNNENGIFQGDQIICTDGLCEQPEPPVMGTCCFYPMVGSTLPSQCYKVAARSTEEDCSNLPDGSDSVFFPDVWPGDIECETQEAECSCIYMDFDHGHWPACWTRNECFCNMTGGVWCCNTTCSEYWEGLDINENCEPEPQDDGCVDGGCGGNLCCFVLGNGTSRCLPCIDPDELCDQDIGCEDGCCVCSGTWCGNSCCGRCLPEEWCTVGDKLGACCHDGECDYVVKDSCVGHWFGPETDCSVVPCTKEEDCECEFEFGACCFTVTNDDIFGTPCIPAIDTTTCEDPSSHDQYTQQTDCQILTATECSDYDGYIDPVYGIEHRTRWLGLGSGCFRIDYNGIWGAKRYGGYQTGGCPWCEENGFKLFGAICEEDSECAGSLCCEHRTGCWDGSCAHPPTCSWFCDGGDGAGVECESDSDCEFGSTCEQGIYYEKYCTRAGFRNLTANCIPPEWIDNYPDFYEMVCECESCPDCLGCQDCIMGPVGPICNPPPEGEVRCNCHATGIIAWDTTCHGCIEAPLWPNPMPDGIPASGRYGPGSSCSDISDFCASTNCNFQDICGSGWMERCSMDGECASHLVCSVEGWGDDTCMYPQEEECHCHEEESNEDGSFWGTCGSYSCPYDTTCFEIYIPDFYGEGEDVHYSWCKQRSQGYTVCWVHEESANNSADACEVEASNANGNHIYSNFSCIDPSDVGLEDWCQKDGVLGKILVDLNSSGACCNSDPTSDEVGCKITTHLECLVPWLLEHGHIGDMQDPLPAEPPWYAFGMTTLPWTTPTYKWNGPGSSCSGDIQTCCDQAISDNTCEETTDCNPGKCCDENMCVTCCESNNDCTIEGECCNEDEGICEECEPSDDDDCENNDDCECGLCCNDGECEECECDLQCDWECVGNEMYPWDCAIETNDVGIWKYHKTCEEGCIDICICDDDEDCKSCECCINGKCTNECGSCCWNGGCVYGITEQNCDWYGGTYFPDMPCVSAEVEEGEEPEESVELLGGCPEPGEDPPADPVDYPPQCLSDSDCPSELACLLGRCRERGDPRKSPDSMPKGACCCRNIDGTLGGGCSYETETDCNTRNDSVHHQAESNNYEFCDHHSNIPCNYDESSECKYCTYMGDGIRCVNNPCETVSDSCTSRDCDCLWFCRTWGSDEEIGEGHAATVYCQTCNCPYVDCSHPNRCGSGIFLPENWWDSNQGSGWWDW